MKQVTLQIPDSKFAFFMQLIHSLNFVEVSEPERLIDTLNADQKAIWENIRTGFEELQMMERGEIRTRPVQDLLNELEG